jgi:hypothetical protein
MKSCRTTFVELNGDFKAFKSEKKQGNNDPFNLLHQRAFFSTKAIK